MFKFAAGRATAAAAAAATSTAAGATSSHCRAPLPMMSGTAKSREDAHNQDADWAIPLFDGVDVLFLDEEVDIAAAAVGLTALDRLDGESSESETSESAAYERVVENGLMVPQDQSVTCDVAASVSPPLRGIVTAAMKLAKQPGVQREVMACIQNDPELLLLCRRLQPAPLPAPLTYNIEEVNDIEAQNESTGLNNDRDQSHGKQESLFHRIWHMVKDAINGVVQAVGGGLSQLSKQFRAITTELLRPLSKKSLSGRKNVKNATHQPSSTSMDGVLPVVISMAVFIVIVALLARNPAIRHALAGAAGRAFDAARRCVQAN